MENQVREALAQLETDLCRHGCGVELISVTDGVVDVRMLAGKET